MIYFLLKPSQQMCLHSEYTKHMQLSMFTEFYRYFSSGSRKASVDDNQLWSAPLAAQLTNPDRLEHHAMN